MTSMYIIIAAGILLLVGVFLIIKGVKARDDERIVPIAEIDVIKEIQSVEQRKGPLQQSTPRLTDHLVSQNFNAPKNAPTATMPSAQVAAISSQPNTIAKSEYDKYKLDSEEKLKSLEAEVQRLSGALQREVSSKQVKTLSQEEREALAQKTKLLTKSQKVIEQLTEEKHLLNKKYEDLKARSVDFYREADKIKKDLEEQRKTTGDINQLKEEIKKLEMENKHLLRSAELIDKINNENDFLHGKQEEYDAQLTQLREDFHDLEIKGANARIDSDEQIHKMQLEKQTLSTQLTERDHQLRALEDKFEEMQTESHQKLETTNKTIESLNSQISEKGQAMNRSLRAQLDAMKDALDEVKKQNSQITDAHQELNTSYTNASELNKSLVEKNKILQYELTKTQAEALGLEKICEDFKILIETA